jgi:RNA polymerase sporulation-specific sigma factor
MAFCQPLPKPLPEKRENELLQLSSSGDQHAQEKLIEHNIRLVIHISNRFKTKFFEEDDVSSVGTIGLIKAVRTFDVKKNIKFATYASRCIENEILMLLRQTKKRDKEDSYELAVSFDSDGNEMSVLDTLGSEKEEIEEKMILNEKVEQLKRIIYSLPGKERDIILYRYGIDKKRKCQSEIAEMFDVSQSYISRVERRIIGKLKSSYKNME